MKKTVLILLWMAVIIASAFGLYRVKYEVQSIRAQIKETSDELAQENESLRVVAAEWAYLNRPDRLQRLASKYLSSEQLTVAQVAEVEAIPFPPVLQASNNLASNNLASNNLSPTAVSDGSTSDLTFVNFKFSKGVPRP